MLRVFLLLAFLIAGVPAAVVAQGSTPDAHTRSVGPNGGKMQHAGANHIELVVNNLMVELYVYDKDLKPVAADGAEASVTFQIKGVRETIKLQHSGANLMHGLTDRVAEPGLRAVVSLKMPDNSVAQARFSF